MHSLVLALQSAKAMLLPIRIFPDTRNNLKWKLPLLQSEHDSPFLPASQPACQRQNPAGAAAPTCAATSTTDMPALSSLYTERLVSGRSYRQGTRILRCKAPLQSNPATSFAAPTAANKHDMPMSTGQTKTRRKTDRATYSGNDSRARDNSRCSSYSLPAGTPEPELPRLSPESELTLLGETSPPIPHRAPHNTGSACPL